MTRAIVTVLCLAAVPARAEENAISVELPALASGLALEGEHLIARRISLVASAGVRSAARGDYDSFTLAGGVEARWWLSRPLARWYLAARLDVARTTLDDENDDRIGSNVGISETLAVGFRWRWGAVELTPSLALGLKSDVDPSGFLAPSTHGTLDLGLTLGWVF